jgi:hypothetical protein
VKKSVEENAYKENKNRFFKRKHPLHHRENKEKMKQNIKHGYTRDENFRRFGFLHNKIAERSRRVQHYGCTKRKNDP